MNSIYCFVLLSIALVSAKKITITIPQHLVPNFLKVSEDCVQKEGSDSDSLNKLLTGNGEDTDTYRKYIYCLTKHLGYLKDDDTVNREKINQLASDTNIKSKFDTVATDCMKLKGNDKYETVFKFVKCFYHDAEVDFQLQRT